MESVGSVSTAIFTSEQPVGILVLLEPDSGVGDALRQLLEGRGWLVRSAESLDELRRRLAEPGVVAVISEASLPGITAQEVLLICQQNQVPAVFTGHEYPVQGAVDLIRQGASDYLEKPFSRQRLLDLLNGMANRQNGSASSTLLRRQT